MLGMLIKSSKWLGHVSTIMFGGGVMGPYTYIGTLIIGLSLDGPVLSMYLMTNWWIWNCTMYVLVLLFSFLMPSFETNHTVTMHLPGLHQVCGSFRVFGSSNPVFKFRLNEKFHHLPYIKGGETLNVNEKTTMLLLGRQAISQMSQIQKFHHQIKSKLQPVLKSKY